MGLKQALEINDNWYMYHDEVYNLAESMLRVGMFEPSTTGVFGPEQPTEAEALLMFFELPDHWTKVYVWWVAKGRPFEWGIWEDGKESEWKVST